MIVWRQKHTQFAQPGYTERNVVGSRMYPTYSAKSIGLLFAVVAALAYLATFAQVNPIWLFGPYDPEKVSAGSQPDWYMFWLEGSLRLMPRRESRFIGHTLDWNVVVPAVALPLGAFLAMDVYPFLERWLTRDYSSHELLDRPRRLPPYLVVVRPTADHRTLGAAATQPPRSRAASRERLRRARGAGSGRSKCAARLTSDAQRSGRPTSAPSTTTPTMSHAT